jgi:hypothetical protein
MQSIDILIVIVLASGRTSTFVVRVEHDGVQKQIAAD